MDYRQYRRARKLVHECCSYDHGQCIALDEGAGIIEPQTFKKVQHPRLLYSKKSPCRMRCPGSATRNCRSQRPPTSFSSIRLLPCT
ncbi:MAG: hypothetical protein HFH57_15235 [Lachnospiraceae bacterium]|nr:hypothetical protein [Lachnospiraceae bacterium]